MLENVLFSINIPKIAVSARHSVIRLILLCLNFTLLLSNFCWRGASLVLSPGAGYPRYATNTHTTGVLKVVQLYGALQTGHCQQSVRKG